MLKRLKKFLSNTSGNVAMTGGLLILPIMGTIGAAIDYTNYINLRNHVQQSIDAAGLAAARELASGATETELKAYAKTFFEANLAGKAAPEEYEFSFKLNLGDSSVNPPIPSSIQLGADIDYKTVFGAFMGVDKVEEDITAVISLGNRTVEVALVMDNSGSMGSNNRLKTMKTETKNLVNTIFNSSSLTHLPEPVKFSLIPFSATVNVGPLSHTNHKGNFMDQRGWSSVHHENLDWLNTYRTKNGEQVQKYKTHSVRLKAGSKKTWLTRFTLFDMLDEPWRGCVEMRPWPHNVLDTYVRYNQGYNKVKKAYRHDGKDDGFDALFVPYFAPDEPDRSYAYKYYGLRHYTDDDYYRNDYLYDWKDYNANSGSSSQMYENDSGDYGYDQSGSSKQINRTNWLFKYQVGNKYKGSLSYNRGPNNGCKTNPITALTDKKPDVISAIDDMTANGNTNIQQGLTWGWRTLSPGLPFDQGRENDDSQNMKFIILLTDGNNVYGDDGDSTPNITSYGAWGYARDGGILDHPVISNVNDAKTHNRWAKGLTSADLAGTIYQNETFDLTPDSGSEFELIMNAHTNQACNNIKSDGISIYTIAFDVPHNGGVRDLLEACAGSGLRDGHAMVSGVQFYHDVDSDELQETFASIASQIANLRIAQ